MLWLLGVFAAPSNQSVSPDPKNPSTSSDAFIAGARSLAEIADDGTAILGREAGLNSCSPTLGSTASKVLSA